MSSNASVPVRRIAVLGAGNMGSGIAQKYATEGFPVVLVDLDDDKVRRGMDGIRATLAQGIERKLFRPEQVDGILGRLEGTSDWTRLADVDVAVEAVFEDREVKRKVFARLEDHCRPDAILATNTSSFSVTELAAGARHPERILGLHYFYHPAKNRLVEVVPGERTSSDALARAWTLQERIGKTPIASADVSGFVVNRYFVPWLNEAVRLVEEGVADIPTVEGACKRAFGVGMGPFELMNVTGVPIALHAARTLAQAFGPLYAPAETLAAQVEGGRNWDLGGEPQEAKFAAVEHRMYGVVFLIAAQLVGDGVGTIEDTDIGARVGLRWPRGPFEMMNRAGVERAAALAREVGKRYGAAVPESLAERGRSARPFTFRWVRSEVRDGVATLTLNRPDAMNALNEEVVAQLTAEFRKAVDDPAIRGIVIAGAGKGFIAGADIRFFVRNLEAGDLARIESFTRAGHTLLDAIDASPKPVVARMHGLALGGGLELALACDRIVASDKAAMAFPETGIGIYPGLGGTQRTTRRVGRGLARWLVFTGQMLPAKDAAAIGLIDACVPMDRLDEAVREALAAGPSADRAPRAVPASHAAIAALFETARPEELLAGKVDTGADAALGKSVARVRGKAPIALRIASDLIDGGADLPLQEGLALELSRLREVFTTRDAYEGLASLGKRAPSFEGR